MTARFRTSQPGSPARRPSVLVLAQDQPTLDSIHHGLKKAYDLAVISHVQQLRESLSHQAIDLLMVEVRLAGTDLPKLISETRTRLPHLPITLLAGLSEVEYALDAISLGATNYLRKPFTIGELRHITNRSLERQRLLREMETLRSGPPRTLAGIIAQDEVMKEVCRLAETVAGTDVTVLLSGETGTGKGLFAKAIHNSSPRREGPYVEINCAAIPATLIESELFGHERGAFTGAVARKIGRVEAAAKGTLLLDEVGEMPLDMQAKMLRFLQEFTFERVGGNEKLSADVRIIAASNRDLGQAVRQGLFREDLFYRLHVIELRVPSLRERREDILPLAEYFREMFSAKYDKPVLGFSPSATGQMLNHAWPGNVREMEHAVERAVILCPGDFIDRLELATESSPNQSPLAPVQAPLVSPELNLDRSLADHMAMCERDYLDAQLKRSQGRVSRTAQASGLNPKTLYLKMIRHGLRKEDFRRGSDGSDEDQG
ncbi:MAG: sigma-54 dependent transcriptional regulator [Desulfarculaceae bacterium]|nr:sigma-54 dependent transcriptional regulator [Desulfarculaceae bacterium]MCF8046315.1 sigma-54 dependent transcriptional regulator [Desulfarculaceae bacterium]MCF8097892.1 sigma-54 dependent transcriptional regulator [Desulfarculaceae bacterium]MCF8121617.1 sigma-54 dependent transcriptional regulator [Desulfarculaceae bacterium]